MHRNSARRSEAFDRSDGHGDMVAGDAVAVVVVVVDSICGDHNAACVQHPRASKATKEPVASCSIWKRKQTKVYPGTVCYAD